MLRTASLDLILTYKEGHVRVRGGGGGGGETPNNRKLRRKK